MVFITATGRKLEQLHQRKEQALDVCPLLSWNTSAEKEHRCHRDSTVCAITATVLSK